MGVIIAALGLLLVLRRQQLGRAFAWNQQRVGGPSSAKTASILIAGLGSVWVAGGIVMLVLSIT